MHILKNRSIRTKIIFLIIVVSTINVIIASGIYYRYDKKRYHAEISKKLRILAKVIGDSNSGTIVFEDTKTAKEYMLSLKAEESVEKASILFPDSTVLVTYDKNDSIRAMNFPLALKTDTVLFLENCIFINTPVIFNNETIAHIRIKYNTDELKLRLDDYYKVIFYILFGSLIMAFILASSFQSIITSPIIQLHKLINKIYVNKDYSIRSVYDSKDEVGHLSRGF
ncbi:MAG: hypothetical protein DRJ10_09440, partial [Bacteroidetes bacterium]